MKNGFGSYFLTWNKTSKWVFSDLGFLNPFVVVQSHSHVRLFVNPWTAAHKASLSFAISWNLLKIMSIESTMPSNYLILCQPLLHLLSTFPSIRIFSNEAAPSIRWPKYCSFSFNISPSNEYSGLISLGLTGLIFLQSKGLSRVFSSINSSVLSLLYGPTLTSIHDSWKNHSFDYMDLCQ